MDKTQEPLNIFKTPSSNLQEILKISLDDFIFKIDLNSILMIHQRGKRKKYPVN